ncbi:Response regulator protein VraR [Paraconexibacter sp. AEG42_29]|uniref:Response regulator protein VraR n=1 Tax=Paraconexibacter sp. AEG42_29 TaxID=2997339 RepID=A0AAU7ATP4_9ACTN
MSQSMLAVASVPVEHRPDRVGVLVVHDEEVVQCGWRLVLSQQPWIARCLTASSTASAVLLASRYKPVVAIVDLDLGHEQAAATTAALTAARPGLRVLLMAGRASIAPKAAQYMGVTGVARKTLPAAELADAVLTVASGQRLFAAPAPQGGGALSAREAQVLTLMADGGTNREIAARLHLAEETVKQHAAAIYRKLKVRNRTEAAQRGRQLGLTLAVT